MLKRIQKKLARFICGVSERRTTSLTMGRSATLSSSLEIHAGHVKIGDYSYIGGKGRISSLPDTNISIGKFTSIASGVQIIGALHKSHITNYSLTRILPDSSKIVVEHGITRGDISIGSDVWIGVNAVILSGVSIGDGAIIGAGAVVTRDIPPYAMAVGVPAIVKKMRFSDSDIELLLTTRWWNLDIEKIRSKAECFYDQSLSASDFIAQITRA
jgi:acetyltransferase-like isoleucine patch superfamily enzyme